MELGIDPDYIDELAEKLEFNMGNFGKIH